ncbi:LysR family transcriptional regulator [Izhakiella australiensis]|uniref:LysR family transcriptional regulator n=1 Tax=Izhakiella australiensis TaxID=1926881 RepID=A0A1S8YQV1_9GAMM|nr:LysR family transcriptional regulator [Izhakiella australiensis]OON41023.1 LysR family transcriptional regulator [Izhakiella australiensis]
MSMHSFVNEVDERQLRYLYEVAISGGVRAAADKIGVNASAVSRQLAQLEKKLDMVLIERLGRGIALTEIGLHLVDFYRERLKRQQELVMQLQEFRQLKRGHIAIGVGEGFIARLLGRALRDFSEHYPDIVVDVRCGSTVEIVEMVREGQVDMGLCTGVDEVDLMVKVRSFRGAPLSAVVSPRHPLAAKKSVTVQELKHHRLIFMSDHFGVQRYLNVLAQTEQVHLSPSYRCNMFAAAQAIAAAGLGVAFMSSDATRHPIDGPQVVVIPIDHPIASGFPSQLICRAGRRMTPAVRNLWQQLERGMKMPK